MLVNIPTFGDTAELQFPHKILIVDDEPYNQEALKNILKITLGLTSCPDSVIDKFTDCANDGQDALSKVKSLFEDQGKVYKIIFMDLNMPKMGGIESSALIREYMGSLDSKIEQTAIIALTGDNPEDCEELTKEAGMDSII